MDNNSGTTPAIGILHPGQMGVSIAAAMAQAGHRVHWASEQRSAATIDRANSAGLHDVTTLEALCKSCSVVFSICPPDQAETLARSVSEAGFSGTYIDCNAVSPATSRIVGACFGATTDFIDGGIIGPPAGKPNTTRLYLSGKNAAAIAPLFNGSVVDAKVIGEAPGGASALKMAYAGWTKGSSALLLTQFALAKQQNIEAALLEEWALSIPDLPNKLRSAASETAPKAWRFVGEMNEIADSLEHAGLPQQWFDGAAASYKRLEHFKNETDIDPDDVIAALLKSPE